MSKTTTATVLVEQKQPPDLTQPTLWQRGFSSLFVTQFQGAFSDNVFKFLVTFLIMGAYGLMTDQRGSLALRRLYDELG